MNIYKTYTDIELLSIVKGGDETGFAEIYERYWAVLYRHAHKMVKDESLAQDIVQEVFVGLWDRISDLHIDLSLSSYLYAAVRNRVLNAIQKERVQERYIDTMINQLNASEAITDHRLREQMLKEKIEEEISGLPAKMRDVFELSRMHHLSYKEIAEKLEISDKTVKKQVSNAIKILRFKLSGFMSLLISLISF